MTANIKVRNFILVAISVIILLSSLSAQEAVTRQYAFHVGSERSESLSYIRGTSNLIVDSFVKINKLACSVTNQTRIASKHRFSLRIRLFVNFIFVFMLLLFSAIWIDRKVLNNFFVHNNCLLVAEYVHLSDGNK